MATRSFLNQVTWRRRHLHSRTQAMPTGEGCKHKCVSRLAGLQAGKATHNRGRSGWWPAIPSAPHLPSRTGQHLWPNPRRCPDLDAESATRRCGRTCARTAMRTGEAAPTARDALLCLRTTCGSPVRSAYRPIRVVVGTHAATVRGSPLRPSKGFKCVRQPMAGSVVHAPYGRGVFGLRRISGFITLTLAGPTASARAREEGCTLRLSIPARCIWKKWRRIFMT